MNEQRFSPDTEGGEEPFNPYLARKSPDQILQERLESEGWQLAGVEHPCITKFTPEAKFEKQRERSDEDIEQEYLAKYGQYGFDEIRLEYSRKMIAGEEAKDDQIIFVYMRQSGSREPNPESQQVSA